MASPPSAMRSPEHFPPVPTLHLRDMKPVDETDGRTERRVVRKHNGNMKRAKASPIQEETSKQKNVIIKIYYRP